MKRKNNKPAEQLINDVNGTKNPYSVTLENVFQEKDRDINPKYISELEQLALRTVAAYKKRQDEIANGGTLADAVYRFMDQKFWVDNVLSYANASVSMLAALADSEINRLVKAKMGYNLPDLVQVLSNTVCLMQDLQMSCMEPLMVMQDIKENALSEGQLQKIIDEYEVRLQVSLSGKYNYA